jgi:hypothetical protein
VSISASSALYEPLSYPILLFWGERGWHPRYRSTAGERMTVFRYYRSFILQNEERLADLGHLAGEFIVDGYSRVADRQLEVLKKGIIDQRRQMSEWETRDHRLDEFAVDGEQRKPEHIKLPAGFLGSPASRAEHTADCMAINGRRGNPTGFLTVTANRDWPEVARRRRTGHTVADKPTVLARAFHRRLLALKAHLRRHFGKQAYIVSVTEFQKRGPPHAHIVFRVRLCSLRVPCRC